MLRLTLSSAGYHDPLLSGVKIQQAHANAALSFALIEVGTLCERREVQENPKPAEQGGETGVRLKSDCWW
jgi:hypothetical protein